MPDADLCGSNVCQHTVKGFKSKIAGAAKTLGTGIQADACNPTYGKPAGSFRHQAID